MKKLHTLVYVSTALVPFDTKSLLDLSEKAAEANKELGITGILYFESNKFLQYLEGPQDEVTSLMRKIEQDARHQVEQVVERKVDNGRKFPNWHMHNLRRPALIKIQMDKVLLKNILMLSKEFSDDLTKVSYSIWGMIDEMSEYRRMLV